MDRVLGTTELLQLVLLGLDEHTLLVSASLVCHSWHDLIQTSPEIQRVLFFRPERARAGAPSASRLNPLLKQHFSGFFADTPQDNASFAKSLKFDNSALEDAFFRPEASWRRMLLQQAPVLRL